MTSITPLSMDILMHLARQIQTIIALPLATSFFMAHPSSGALENKFTPSHFPRAQKRPSNTSKPMSITRAANTLTCDTIISDKSSIPGMWTSVPFPLHPKQLIFSPSLSASSNIRKLSNFFHSTLSSKPPLFSFQ